MALPASGAITVAMLHAEFAGGYSLSSYYRGGGYVTANNTGVPTSGPISLANFYSAVKYVPGNITPQTSGTGSFVVPAGVTTIYVTGTGGGAGGGSQCGANPSGNVYRSGGGGGGCIDYGLSVVAGDTIAFGVGAGGSYLCGVVGQSGAAGGDTYVNRNGGRVLTLGGAPNENGGSGPLAGGTSVGYFGTPGYSGAQASGLIGGSYGVGGAAGSDYYYSGIGGYIYIYW